MFIMFFSRAYSIFRFLEKLYIAHGNKRYACSNANNIIDSLNFIVEVRCHFDHFMISALMSPIIGTTLCFEGSPLHALPSFSNAVFSCSSIITIYVGFDCSLVYDLLSALMRALIVAA
jgi:hypothetical protein